MRQARYDARRKRRDPDDDDDDEVEDGRGIRTPMMMMDTKPKPVRWISPLTDAQAQAATDAWARRHQPHFIDSNSREVQTARDAARAARDEKIKAQANAWRGSASTPPVVTDAREARRQWIDRQTNAWRNPTPVRDAEQFHRVSPQEFSQALGTPNPMLQPPRRDADADAVERRRSAEHADRKLRLSEAWKTPTGTGNPNRATEIETARRAVTHEGRR